MIKGNRQGSAKREDQKVSETLSSGIKNLYRNFRKAARPLGAGQAIIGQRPVERY